MIPKDQLYLKDGERGIPYSLTEAKKLAEQRYLDEYYREVLCWLIYEVERLTAQNKSLLNTSSSSCEDK